MLSSSVGSTKWPSIKSDQNKLKHHRQKTERGHLCSHWLRLCQAKLALPFISLILWSPVSHEKQFDASLRSTKATFTLFYH